MLNQPSRLVIQSNFLSIEPTHTIVFPGNTYRHVHVNVYAKHVCVIVSCLILYLHVHYILQINLLEIVRIKFENSGSHC